ncbi:MAG: hypothetical protein PHC68_17750 [Syntrophorhabdaceae bacterium]|nr:hypothetical protein [Syntrophorhabdaceae bacterium]
MKIINVLVAVVIVSSMMAPEAGAVSISGILKENQNKSLPKMTKKEEAEYINEHNIRNNFAIKVTTKNQSKFDREGDGYLNDEELRDYLKKYDKGN